MAEHQRRSSHPDPDQEAVAAFRAGDAGAFDTLVDRHEGRVYRLAWRILGERDAALDAAQETFVKAWKALPRFEGKARFSTWLTRIAINQCRNELRKRGTVKHTRPLSLDAPTPGTQVPRGASVASSDAAAWEHLQEDELRSAFEEIMRALEPEAREVLILTEVEALSYEDIAELLDVPVGTVRSRLHRARADVRRRMAERVGVPRE